MLSALRKSKRLCPLFLCAAVLLAAHARGAEAGAAPRPNIVVILADDLGFSDLGSYGGEIPTPNLDCLARGGLRFTQFYNTSRCCPTRASLLTGLYQHQTGIGMMTSESTARFDFGVDGYRGELNRNCVTVAEVLKQAGYHTYLSGKWHLGAEDRDDCERRHRPGDPARQVEPAQDGDDGHRSGRAEREGEPEPARPLPDLRVGDRP